MNEQTPVVKVEDFNVLDRKVQACPYPYYKAMRSECPVYQSPHTGMMYVTKYDDIRDMARAAPTLSNRSPGVIPPAPEMREMLVIQLTT